MSQSESTSTFVGYTILTESEELPFLLDSLSYYFGHPTRSKAKQNPKYREWLTTNKTHTPYSVYSFMKKHTTLTIETKILRTMTSSRTMYRVQNKFYKTIQKQHKNTPDKTGKTIGNETFGKKSTEVDQIECPSTIPNENSRTNATSVDFLEKDTNDSQKDNNQTPSTHTKVIDVIPPSHTKNDPKENDDDTMATPTETIKNKGTETSDHISPSINTMTNQMETDLDQEIASIVDLQTETHITDIAVVVDEIITQQLPKIIENIRTDLQTQFNTHYTEKFNTIDTSIKTLKDDLTTHHAKVLTLQTELANIVNDVGENHAKITQEITEIKEQLNTKFREKESTSTVHERLHTVQAQIDNLAKQQTTTGINDPFQQQEELKQLYRAYRERITRMDNRIAKMNYEDVDLNMDTLLVSKMNAFDTYYLQKSEEFKAQHKKLVSEIELMKKTQYVPPQSHLHQPQFVTDGTNNTTDATKNTTPSGSNTAPPFNNLPSHRNPYEQRSYEENVAGKMNTGTDPGTSTGPTTTNTGMNNHKQPTVPVPVPDPVHVQNSEQTFSQNKNTSTSSTYDVRTHNSFTENGKPTHGHNTYDNTATTTSYGAKLDNPYDKSSRVPSASKNSYSASQNQTKPLYDDSPPHFHVTRHPHNPYDKLINTEYLRKNIKISCSDDSTLLEFYIKLRLLIKKGGIYLKPLDELSVDVPIYEEKLGYTATDYMNQSNGLHTLLSNEEIIPIDYTKAQNCIQATSDTMNGFAALKSMLTTVHPKFTKTQPDNTPPLYSMYNDLHLYEQSIRTYYLKHFLYDGYQRPELHKTEQYLKGLDAPEYENAKQRLIVQMDNLKIFGGDLPEQYNITNISGTITNMDPYQHGSTTPTVNTMQRTNQTNRPRSYPQSKMKIRDNQNQRKQYTNNQCGACKLFGHRTNECRHVGKILAVMDLQRNNPKLCSKILNSHIQKNNPDKRMKIIQSLQTINAIPQHANFDDYMLTDIIDDTITHTVNLTDNVIPDEIAPENQQE